MKVRVVLTVDIDADQWRDYTHIGSDGSAAEVREDVKSYVLTNIVGAALIEECDGTVALGN